MSARPALRGALLPVLLSLALPAVARGEGNDLAPDATDWNGLSAWITALRDAGVNVETPPALDLAALGPDHSVALIDPARLEPETAADLRRFVAEGGRLLLAVEGRGADPLLAELGLRPDAPPAEGDPRLGGHPGLPVLEAPDTGLLAGVRHVVANHPAALRGPADLRPAISFANGAAFLYHLRLGGGEMVVVADASVFINLMQGAGDNARLIAALGAWLSAGGTRAITVVAGGTPVSGRYAGIAPPPEAAGARGLLNSALAQLRVPAPDGLVVRLVVALLLAATVIFALSVFPGGARTARRLADAGTAAGGRRADDLAGRPGGPAAPERRSRA